MQCLGVVSKTEWSWFITRAFSLTAIQVYVPNTVAKNAELDRFYEDLQHHLELIPKRDVFFITENWNIKLQIQEAPRITRKFGHFSSVSQSCPTLGPQGMKHTKPPCPSPTPKVYSNSCPLSWWCHSAISSSVVPFSFHLQSYRVSGSFQMSQFFTSGSQSIGASASASVLQMNIQEWCPLGWTGLILQSKGLSRVFSNIKFKIINFSVLNSHIHTWLLDKP